MLFSLLFYIYLRRIIIISIRLVDDVGFVTGGHDTDVGLALVYTRVFDVKLNV